LGAGAAGRGRIDDPGSDHPRENQLGDLTDFVDAARRKDVARDDVGADHGKQG
jgi:hypothetical protein